MGGTGALAGVAGLLLLVSACTHTSPDSTPASSPSVNPAGHGRIEKVFIVPYPEGVSLGFGTTVGSKSRTQFALADIQAAIPDPLPLPVQQGHCDSGHWDNIEFQDGATIGYGPCARPASIERLDASINTLLTAARNPPCPVNPSACPPPRGKRRAFPPFPYPRLVMRPNHGAGGTVVHLTALVCRTSAPVDGRRGRFADSTHLHGPDTKFGATNVSSTTAKATFRVPARSSRGPALFVIFCAGDLSAAGYFHVT